MELLRGIWTRKSTRAFNDKPIDKSILKKIILVAFNASFYSNTQPWELVVVIGNKRDEPAISRMRIKRVRSL
jgi:nitroreductase